MTPQLAVAIDDSVPLPDAGAAKQGQHHLCAACHERPARFQYRGLVKADRTHTLCFRCYRSVMDSIRNVEPVGRVTWIRSAGGRTTGRSTGGAVAEAADKYVQLERRRRRAQIAARHALEEVGE